MSHSHKFTTYALQRQILDSLEDKRLLEGAKKTLELRLEVERRLRELRVEYRRNVYGRKTRF